MLALRGGEVALSNRWAGKAAQRSEGGKKTGEGTENQAKGTAKCKDPKVVGWGAGRHGGCLRNSKEAGAE